MPGSRGRQNQIHEVGGDGAARHGVVLGVGGVLGDGDAAVFFDSLEAEGAVGPCPREYHADGVSPVSGGQGAQKYVDGHAPAARLLQLGEPNLAIHHGQILRRAG